MAILAKDTFTPPPSANEDIAGYAGEVGPAWVAIQGNFVMTTQEAHVKGSLFSGPVNNSVYEIKVSPKNYTVTVKIDPDAIDASEVPAPDFFYAGICARRRTSSTPDNYYMAVVEKDPIVGTDKIYLRFYKVVEGVLTSLRKTDNVPYRVDTLLYNISSSTHTVKWGGVQYIKISNSAISTGNPGIVSNVSGPVMGSEAQIDNFLVTGVGAPFPPPPPPPISSEASMSKYIIQLRRRIMSVERKSITLAPFLP